MQTIELGVRFPVGSIVVVEGKREFEGCQGQVAEVVVDNDPEGPIAVLFSDQVASGINHFMRPYQVPRLPIRFQPSDLRVVSKVGPVSKILEITNAKKSFWQKVILPAIMAATVIFLLILFLVGLGVSQDTQGTFPWICAIAATMAIVTFVIVGTIGWRRYRQTGGQQGFTDAAGDY